MNDLRHLMEQEGWTFWLRCPAYQHCTMEVHMLDPNGNKHAVTDDAALHRYYSTKAKRTAAIQGAEERAVRA